MSFFPPYLLRFLFSSLPQYSSFLSLSYPLFFLFFPPTKIKFIPTNNIDKIIPTNNNQITKQFTSTPIMHNSLSPAHL